MISSAKIVKKVSAKEKEYYVLELSFSNGYTMTVFLDNNQQFILKEYIK